VLLSDVASGERKALASKAGEGTTTRDLARCD
jgi:hypothetical protein